MTQTLLSRRRFLKVGGTGYDPVTQSRLAGWLNRVFKIAPEGDCRDWNAIRTWAMDLKPRLAA